MVIDNRPLQHAAWSEFHTARKRSEKAAADLLRHEETDAPAYEAWLHSTFPVLITTLRELHKEVSLKAHQVEAVELMGAMTGRSLRKLWREYKERAANPEAYDREAEPEPDPDTHASYDDDAEFADDFFKNLFGDDANERPDDRPEDGLFGRATPVVEEPPPDEARDLYRRLVQHLHPDRGGEWTPARERLWHEVQQAWAARDVDWLARLEIGWETANNTLGPDSSVGRLRQAIAELHAARRDTERRLREYRGSFPWRFTLSAKKRPQLERRVEDSLRDDLDYFQRQLAHLTATIAAWERAPSPKRRRSSR